MSRASSAFGTLHKTLIAGQRWLAPLGSRRCPRGMATAQDMYQPAASPTSLHRHSAVMQSQPEAHSVIALVRSLRQYMGPMSGINGTESQVSHLKSLMARCRPNIHDWKRYGSIDPSRSYTRLHVDDINGKCNLLFIVWNAGSQSPIHNHANALCVMKIVKGTLNETVFDKPSSGPLTVQRDSFHSPGKVAFISDDVGVHRMSNPDVHNYTVSLHLYTPPHAADYGFSVFDQHTGQRTHVPGRIALSEPPLAQAAPLSQLSR